jgi:hypothetical protein
VEGVEGVKGVKGDEGVKSDKFISKYNSYRKEISFQLKSKPNK